MCWWSWLIWKYDRNVLVDDGKASVFHVSTREREKQAEALICSNNDVKDMLKRVRASEMLMNFCVIARRSVASPTRMHLYLMPHIKVHQLHTEQKNAFTSLSSVVRLSLAYY